ncbi:hypothetical protein TNCV_4630081 [Trichonephila clavipes]|nr:hypothetical protein TNCV_4630081 [Trichonephila clavipes]
MPPSMICWSIRPPMLIPAHTIKAPSLLWGPFGTNIGLFQRPLSRHPKIHLESHYKMNPDSSVNRTLLHITFVLLLSRDVVHFFRSFPALFFIKLVSGPLKQNSQSPDEVTKAPACLATYERPLTRHISLHSTLLFDVIASWLNIIDILSRKQS